MTNAPFHCPDCDVDMVYQEGFSWTICPRCKQTIRDEDLCNYQEYGELWEAWGYEYDEVEDRDRERGRSS